MKRYKENGRTILASLALWLIGLPCTAAIASEPVHDPAMIEAIIADIERGWETADGAPFREHFLDFEGARYIETGGQNEGLDDLVEHHVEPEGDALEFLHLTYSNIEVHFEGSFAWAVTDVQVEAKVRSDGREIDNTGYGTYLFRWVDGRWRVVHSHSSTRRARREN